MKTNAVGPSNQAQSGTYVEGPSLEQVAAGTPARLGHKGAPVELAQAKLNQLGFTSQDGLPLKNDAKLGPKTTFALKAFQKEAGLPETGFVDAATLEALQNAGKPEDAAPTEAPKPQGWTPAAPTQAPAAPVDAAPAPAPAPAAPRPAVDDSFQAARQPAPRPSNGPVGIDLQPRTAVFRGPPGVKLGLDPVDVNETAVSAAGVKVAYNASRPVLTITNADGKEIPTKVFDENNKLVDARSLNEKTAYTQLNSLRDGIALADASARLPAQWESRGGIQPYGSAGQLVSTKETLIERMPSPPTLAAELKTYDARTGEQVRLSDLVSPKQMQEIVNQVRGQLMAMPNGKNFVTSDLQSAVDRSFALVTEPDGRVSIDIGLRQQRDIPTDSFPLARFTLPAPTGDAKFRELLGL